jgi:glycosyltransferase involved in cell wall biosynthesis
MNRVCIVRHRDYEPQLRREAEALRDAGFDVDAIVLRDEGHPAVEDINGIRVIGLPLRRRRGGVLRYVSDYLGFFVLASLRLTREHVSRRYAVVQVNTMPDFLVFCTLPAMLLGAKVIAFMKEPSPELAETLFTSSLVPRVYRLIERLVLRYADLVFTVTEDLKEAYVARGADARKIRVVLNGPDPRHWDVPDLPSTTAPMFTAVCHGSIEDRYGHDVIVRAVHLVRDRLPDLRVRIPGDGTNVGEVERLISTLGVGDQVELLGWLDQSDLVKELCQADVGLVSQRSSPYSNLVHTIKMYDFLMLGKPVVASRLRSTARYFDDTTLRYYKADDPADLANALLELHDCPAQRRSYAEVGVRRYEQLGWATQRKIFVDGYHDLLGWSSEADHNAN